MIVNSHFVFRFNQTSEESFQMSTRTAWNSAGICALFIGVMTWYTWSVQSENQRLLLVNSIFNAENRIIKDEIAELAALPTYDQGYKAALIRVGGPQQPGAYQDGWDDALKICNTESDYADGYHAAIQQFGYTKTTAMNRWLVPEPDANIVTENEGIVPTKLEK